MKKKMLAAAVCIMVGMTALGGCKKLTPEEALMKAQKKSAEMDAIDMDMSLDVSAEIEGVSLSIPITMNIKTKDIKTDNLTMEMNMKLELMGMSLNTKMYYTDGYYYMDAVGQKTKNAMDMEEMKKQLTSQMSFQEIQEGMYQEVTVEKDGANSVYTFTGNADKFDDILTEYLSTLKSAFGEEMSFKFSNLNGTVTVDKDDNIIKSDMNVDIEMLNGEKSVKASLKGENTYNAFGDEVTVTLPDLSEFKETDGSSLFNPDKTETPDASGTEETQAFDSSSPQETDSFDSTDSGNTEKAA